MEDTKERILAAALELFALKGYASVGTRAIARAAAVNEVTLFRSFGSKRNLYLEVYRHFSIAPSQVPVPSSFTGNLETDLAEVARAVAGLFIRNSKIVNMSFKDMGSFPEIDRDLKAQPGRLMQSLADYFRLVNEALPLSSRPEELASTFVTAIMGSTLHLLHMADEAAVYFFAGEFSMIFSRGIRA